MLLDDFQVLFPGSQPACLEVFFRIRKRSVENHRNVILGWLLKLAHHRRTDAGCGAPVNPAGAIPRTIRANAIEISWRHRALGPNSCLQAARPSAVPEPALELLLIDL